MAQQRLQAVKMAKATKQPFWSWREDDFIAQGNISGLACFESIVAFGLYYWLASITQWPWQTMLSFFAVPLLLLRSKDSMLRGVQLLNGSDIKNYLTTQEGWLIRCISTITSAIVCYWAAVYMAQHWLNDLHGVSIYWRSAVLGAVTAFGAIMGAVAVTVGVTGAILGAVAGTVETAATVVTAVSMIVKTVSTFIVFGVILEKGVGAAITAGITAFAVSMVVVAVGKRAIAGAVTGAVAAKELSLGAATGAVMGVGAKYEGVIFIPSVVVGICIMGLFIRVRATLTWLNLKAGIEAFKDNLYETVLVSDMRHASALLPGAGKVDRIYSAASLRFNKNDKFLVKSLNIFLLAAIFVVATVYRWNIKANAWIWGAIAFGLREPVWKPTQDAKKRKRAAVLTSWITIGAVVTLWLFLALVWIKAIANQRVFAVFNKLQGTFLADIADLAPVIPIYSLLFGALTLLTISLFLLIVLSTLAHIVHHPAYSNQADWGGEAEKIEEHRIEGRNDAKLVTKALQWNLVFAYFFVCTVFFMVFSYFRADLMPTFENKTLWEYVASPQFMKRLME
jgi:hypothetical protein